MIYLLRTLTLCVFGLATLTAQTRLLLRPHYHQGKIVFSYQGDLWVVNENGANPARLTTHNATDMYPRFSPDGQWIAFTSARSGGGDVYVMPAAGGEARQLTWHSAADTVLGWSPDGKKILFTSARGDAVFPVVSTLYEVAAGCGLETPVGLDMAGAAAYSPDGRKLAVQRHSASATRRHYRGSNNGDLWVMDLASRQFKSLVDAEFKGNMLWPMYGAKGEIYFVSDRLPNEKGIVFGGPEVMKSVNNIWRIGETGGKWAQVTKHASGSLFYPSISYDGKTIVYEQDYGLWKLDTASGRTAEIKVNLVTDRKENSLEWRSVTSTAESFDLSPSGRRIAIAAQGEIFTVAADRGEPRRVTRSQRRESAPRWSPNGKWIAYVSDESGREEVWIADEAGKTRKKLTDMDTEKRSLVWSNDSRFLLFGSSDNRLYQLDIADGRTRVVAESETGTPSQAQFSPDDKWLVYTRTDRDARPHVYVKAPAGGAERMVGTDELFSASAGRWTPDGKKLVLIAGVVQMGMASLGRQISTQLYTVGLVKEDKDPTYRGIDSEAEAAASRPAPGAGAGAAAAKPAPVVVQIDWDGIEKRIRQITRLQDSVTNCTVSADSRLAAFTVMSTGEGARGSSLYTIQLDGERMTRVAASQPRAEGEEAPPTRGMFGGGGFISSPQFARDGRSLYYMEGGGIYSVAVAPPVDGPSAGASGSRMAALAGGGSAAATPAPQGRRVNFSLKVEVDREALRAQVFDESWRIMKYRFYDSKMHGVDWEAKRKEYAELLPFVADDTELSGMMMYMIGELNASHTGVTPPRADERSAAPVTRLPGFDLEADASGYYKVKSVWKKGPADKDFIRLKPGDFILALNGTDIRTPDNYWKLFTLSTERRWEFTVNSKPEAAGAWKVELEPLASTAISNAVYERWVESRKRMVEKLTGGEIGYLHIRAMDAASLRKFELDLQENRFKRALIIDQRFNGGGGIDQELLRILAQKRYQVTERRGALKEDRPQQAYFGPMVVVQNERSFSDAEMFPDGFRTLGLGKLVGVPTGGAVIGTGAASLLNGGSIRTPGVAVYTARGQNMENYGVPPDVYVDNTPGDFLAGRDAQIEKAIEVLRADLAGKR
jgi:tricorn protease